MLPATGTQPSNASFGVKTELESRSSLHSQVKSNIENKNRGKTDLTKLVVFASKANRKTQIKQKTKEAANLDPKC